MLRNKTVAILLMLVAGALAGCGLGVAPKPQPGVISVTDAQGLVQGQLSSVSVKAAANVSVNVANDQNLGVDWTVTCDGSQTPGQSAPFCGTISPAHSNSSTVVTYTAPDYVPLDSNVIITATSTADPTQSSSVTLTILLLPITIAFASSTGPVPPPTSITVGVTAPLIAAVTNDTTDQGVKWTVVCGSSACGSFSSGNTIANQTASGQQMMYTAPSVIPAGGTVTVTATSVADITKSKTAVINIIPPIAVSVTPASVTLQSGTTQNFSATVSNDISNAGVIWSCSPVGTCGSFLPTQTASGVATTYTAPASVPSGGKVTVTATSVTDSTRFSTASITITPNTSLSVTLSPAPPANLGISATTPLTATVANDASNKGVSWSCLPAGACGSFSSAQTASGIATTYTAPSGAGTVTIIATSVADTTKSTSAKITILAPVSIAFTQAPTSPATTSTTQSLSATVTNDVAPGGVDWICIPTGACGTFTPQHTANGAATTYTVPLLVPPGGAVTISATSTTDNSKQVNQTINVVASTVTAISFYPSAPSAVIAASTVPVNLTAVVANDASYAGVDWSVCSSQTSCGQFLVTPAQPVTPTNPTGTPAVFSNTVHTASGVAAIYYPPAQVPSSTTVTITATSHATPTAQVTASPAVVSTVVGVAITGKVLSGSQAIIGAHVALYAAGTAGYSSAATLLSPGTGYVVSDASGNFTIPTTYTCPSQTSQLYLLATGGNAGAGANANIALMTALGSCNGISSSAVVVNEVTTAASVWALAQFMSSDVLVGSSSANASAGMLNAFAAVNNLVDSNIGQALSVTLTGNGTVPQTKINSLASILAACVQSNGGSVGDGSVCGALFFATNTTISSITAPVDTLQAALNIVQNGGFLASTIGTASTLFALQPATPVYSPALSAAPYDWTLAISFAGGGLESSGNASNRPISRALAIDAAGNVWVTNSHIPSVTELSAVGAPLSPWTAGTTLALAGGFKDALSLNSPSAIAIDLLGDVWIGNSNGSLTELNYAGADMSGAGGYTGGGLGSTVSLAIDSGNSVTSPGGNVWAASVGATGVAKINGSSGAAISGASGYPGTSAIGSTSGALAIDGAGTVWVGDSGNGTMAEFNQVSGSLTQTDNGSISTTMPPTPSQLSNGIGATIAIDGNGTGNIWVPGSSNSIAIAELNASGIGGTIYTPAILTKPGSIAIDGSGHVWMPSSGNSSFSPVVPPVIMELSNTGSSMVPLGYVGPNIANGMQGLAVDESGNLWVLIGGNYSTLTEFLGIASPVITPISVAAEKNKLGKKP